MSTYLEKNAKEVFVDAEVMFKAFIYTEQEWNE